MVSLFRAGLGETLFKGTFNACPPIAVDIFVRPGDSVSSFKWPIRIVALSLFPMELFPLQPTLGVGHAVHALPVNWHGSSSVVAAECLD